MRALLIVDVQKDFLPGGALGVPAGDEIIPEIMKRLSDYRFVIASRDWHPKNHISFSDNPQFKDKSWPSHCVQDTEGAEIHSMVQHASEFRVSKGMDADEEAYSAFDGYLDGGAIFEDWIHEVGITNLDVVGLALDYCVKASAIDARKHGLNPRVILPATKPVAPDTGLEAVEGMAHHGVLITA